MEQTVVDIRIGEGEGGSRIDRFLGNRFYPAYSRSFLTGLISAGKIKVNGRPVRPAYRLGEGDHIVVVLEPNTEGTPKPEAVELRILHEDEFVLVVEKPAGMVVHPGPGTPGGTLVNALLHHDASIAKVGLVSRPGIVHRLDGNTSGVMVVAKTNHARVNLVEQFKSKRVTKEYRALVVGSVPFDSDYIDLPIGRSKKHAERMAIDEREGKSATSFYEVIERFSGATYVRVMPKTGRTHQIRLHLAHLGFPVMADAVYGKNVMQGWYARSKRLMDAGEPYPQMDRHALHAFRLNFKHPVSGEEVEFTSPLPDDMEWLLRFYQEHARVEEAQ